MASSIAPVNPPFAYDPSCKPTKSILKQKSRLSRTPSSWLSNINLKLSSTSMNFTTESSIPFNNNQQVQQQEPAPVRSMGLLNFKKFMNNINAGDTSSITSNNSSLQQDLQQNNINTTTTNNNNSNNNNNNNSNSNNNATFDTDELAPDELKRVRFSVKQLTTEYYPYRNPTQEEQEEQPSPSSSIDAPELPENAAALLLSDHTEPQQDDAKLEKAALCDDKKKTPLELYEIACRNKEELPFPGFVINLSQCISLTKIDLSNQTIQRRVIEPIVDVLGLGFDLQELVLKNCDLEDDALKVLLHTLLLNDTLRHLNLAENKKLKTNGFKYIAIYVKGSRKLERLDLSMTNPDKKAIQYLAQALTASSSSSKSYPSLEQLVLDGCLLKLPSLETLAAGVRKSPNLRHLSLVGNKISDQGAIWLGVMLCDYDNPEYIKGLEYLNLSNNDLRQGVQYIAQALRRNQSLTELYLHDCKLGSKACAFIGEALKYNQALLKLDISANSLVHPTAEGILAIKQALYVNWALKELNMSAAGLQSEAAIYLAECLPENRSLLHLDLSKNMGIDLAGLMALSASVRCNDTLTYMDINIPPNDREMAKIQGDIVARCTKNAQNPPPPPRVRKNIHEQQTVRHMGSQNSLDPNTMVTTTQATARLSLQERLAAVTRGKVSSGPINNKPTTPAEDIKNKATLPPQKPSRQTSPPKKKPVIVDADMIITATTQISLFEDMLSAEASQRDDVVDSVQAPGEVILQVYGQCRKSQTEISGYIPQVTDDDELAQLLVLNDRLTTAISKYQQYFASGATTPTATTATEQQPKKDEGGNEETSLIAATTVDTKNDTKISEESSSVKTSSSFLLEGTEPPLSTSFEIGDVDDEDDDLVPPRHPSPGIESQ